MARRNYTYKGVKQGAKKRGRVYGRAGYQLYRDINYLRTLVNSELNSHQEVNTNNIDSTGEITNLDSIPQGDGENSRTGNSVLPRFLSVNININKKIAAGVIDHETFRLILFRYWGEQTSAAPSVTVAEILDSFSAIGPRSFLNEDNTGRKGDRERRIEVLKSKLFTLDNVAQTSRTWKWHIEVNGVNVQRKEHLKYRSSSTENPISGGFYILIISDNATGANKSSFNLHSKLNFHDN